MKFITADLLEDVVSSYDQTKTTVQGRASVKTVDGGLAVGPPLNRFIDSFTDASLTPVANAAFLSDNGRMFVADAEASGLVRIAMWELDSTTLQQTFRGRIQINIADTPASVHTFRGFKVIDTGTTGWKLFLTTTSTIRVQNGGSYLVNNIDRSDFVPVGFPTIPFASGNNQKAVYKLENALGAIGASFPVTAAAGTVLDVSASRLYVHNGVSATHQYYVYDTSVSPTYSNVTGLTIDQATDRVTDPGHPYVANDPVLISSLTGGAGLTNNTAYFVLNPTANDYQLSATVGGTAINITTNGTATVGRAFGTTTDLYLHATGNLPALAGTLLLTNSESFATPQHTTNAGTNCAFFATTTNLYLGQLSELTAGAVTWPSLVTSNVLGSVNEVVVPIPLQADWSNSLDMAVFSNAGNVIIGKQVINNQIDMIFGGSGNRYLEGVANPEVVELQPLAAINSLNMGFNGVLAIGGSSIGQRGIFIADIRSNSPFDYSYVVTKVLDADAETYKFITSLDRLFAYTGSLEVYYRTSGFGSISGGWLPINFSEDLSIVATASQIQFKILYDTLGLDTCIPAQLTEFILGFNSINQISDNWEYSHDDSTSGNPTRISFRLKEAYDSAVPQLFFRAYDLTNVQITSANTVAQAANFEYSTDSGASWSPLGTIPNTVGTLVRYTYVTPPGVDIRPSIRES